MRRPTDEQLDVLAPMEKVAFAIADRVNRWPLLKGPAQAYLRTFGKSWVYHCTKHLLHVYGREKLADLAPDRGVMLASNHRSFFDLYVISSVLFRSAPWVSRLFFPVRSDYFYDRPDGVVVNALMSALAMYPPVLRDPKKRAFNQFTVDVLADVLAEPGAVVGMHPEGTRNKTDDPYTLLPAQPGVGQIALAARPIVVPMFTLGLTNDFPRQVASNWTGKGEPITLVIGDPIDLDALYQEPPRLRTYKRIADRISSVITALGQEEREIRRREGFPSLEPVSRVTPRRQGPPKADVA